MIPIYFKKIPPLKAIAMRELTQIDNLILENDVYRYVLDGQNLLHLQNPYQLSPEQIRNDPTHPLKSQLDHFLSAQVLERTSYPKISTVYPPVAQVVFAVGALLTGWDWRGQRYVLLLVDLAVIGSLLILLKRLQIFPGYVMAHRYKHEHTRAIANFAICSAMPLHMHVATRCRYTCMLQSEIASCTCRKAIPLHECFKVNLFL